MGHAEVLGMGELSTNMFKWKWPPTSNPKPHVLKAQQSFVTSNNLQALDKTGGVSWTVCMCVRAWARACMRAHVCSHMVWKSSRVMDKVDQYRKRLWKKEKKPKEAMQGVPQTWAGDIPFLMFATWQCKIQTCRYIRQWRSRLGTCKQYRHP